MRTRTARRRTSRTATGRHGGATRRERCRSSGTTSTASRVRGRTSRTSAPRPATRRRAYYSFDIGTWHAVVLNSNCTLVSCAAGSAQDTWLEPTWPPTRRPARSRSSTTHGSARVGTAATRRSSRSGPPSMRPGSRSIVNGHEHDYERFAPQTPAGAPDPTLGIRQFVVGTGWNIAASLRDHRGQQRGQERDVLGCLKLTLHASGYDYAFVPIAGQTFTDTGSGSCHRAAGLTRVRGPTDPTVITWQRNQLRRARLRLRGDRGLAGRDCRGGGRRRGAGGRVRRGGRSQRARARHAVHLCPSRSVPHRRGATGHASTGRSLRGRHGGGPRLRPRDRGAGGGPTCGAARRTAGDRAGRADLVGLNRDVVQKTWREAQH